MQWQSESFKNLGSSTWLGNPTLLLGPWMPSLSQSQAMKAQYSNPGHCDCTELRIFRAPGSDKLLLIPVTL